MGVIALLALFATLWVPAAAANSWSHVTTPNHAPPEVIGSPAAGCVSGAVILPPTGVGYQVMRLSRHRNYGHPSLIHFVRTLGEALVTNHTGVMLVGDLSQPRGGPTASLHRSHQNGLDVDLWYWLPDVARERHLDDDEVETLAAPSMVNRASQSLDLTHWTSAQVELVRLVATSPEVDRIFVNPVIKKTLCEQESDRGWLHTVRPWWGHDDHLHVRLHCPPGNEACVSQKPIPTGDGCDSELDWWLQAIATAPKAAPPPPPPAPVLPAACESVLHAH